MELLEIGDTAEIGSEYINPQKPNNEKREFTYRQTFSRPSADGGRCLNRKNSRRKKIVAKQNDKLGS